MIFMQSGWPGRIALASLAGFSLSITLAQPSGADRSPGTADRPNILVVLVDDFGVMDSSVPFLLDANGQPERHPLNDRYRTPNLERLAGQGVRFSNFLAMSVCSPSRISLLTGQTSARHRTTNWIQPEKNNAGEFGPRDWNWQGMSADHVSLPRLLQAAGYHTIQIGKGHLGPFGSAGADPRIAGFDVSVGGSAMGQPGSYFSRDRFGNGPNGPLPRGGLTKREPEAQYQKADSTIE